MLRLADVEGATTEEAESEVIGNPSSSSYVDDGEESEVEVAQTKSNKKKEKKPLLKDALKSVFAQAVKGGFAGKKGSGSGSGSGETGKGLRQSTLNFAKMG